MTFLRRVALPFALAALFLALAVRVLPDYGPTFDAVLGDYAYGERLLDYLESGDESELRFGPTQQLFPVNSHPEWPLTYPLKWVYPLPAIGSAFGCERLAMHSGWLHPIDAHHFIAPLSFAALLFLVYRFVERRAGGLAALSSVLLMATHPHLFGNAMNDIKDTPTLFIVYAALFAYVRVLEDDSRGALFLGGVLTGIGLATKVNAIWPIAFFGVVFVLRDRFAVLRDAERRRRFLPALIALPVVIAVTYVICSPQYRVDGWNRFVEHARYALFESTRSDAHAEFSFEPILNLGRTAPLAFFPLTAIGFVVALRRRTFRPATLALLLLIGIVPAVRPCFPGMRYFNLIRHFLEVLPIAAMFGGIAVATMARAIATRLSISLPIQNTLATALAIVPAAFGAYSVASVHPFQTCYFNAWVGGLGGAQARGIADADDYWCHSSRRCIAELNEFADHGAIVIDPFAPWMIESMAFSGLRPDLKFVGSEEGLKVLLDAGLLDENRDVTKWQAAPIVIVCYVPQTRRFNQKPGPRVELMRYVEEHMQPWRVMRSDGGEIVRYYRIETTAKPTTPPR